MGEENKLPALLQVTDVIGAGKVFENLFQLVERGVGPLFRPWLDARHNTQLRVDLGKQIDDLNVRGFDIDSADLSIDGRMTANIRMRARKEQNNREDIAIQAISELRSRFDGKIESEELQDFDIPDVDWLDQYWDLAGRISSHGRQLLWARILARAATGQIVSARSLHLLSTLSRDEAEMLSAMASYAVRSSAADVEVYGILTEVRYSKGQLETGAAKLLAEANLVIGKSLSARAGALFGSIGLLVENGWKYGFYCQPVAGRISLSIANHPFFLRAVDAPLERYAAENSGHVSIGGGIQLSPVGADLLALVEAELDLQWLKSVQQAYRAIGLELFET